jgi:hypothetical protein
MHAFLESYLNCLSELFTEILHDKILFLLKLFPLACLDWISSASSR